MTRMGDHSRPAAAGRVPRRAMFSVWAVFLSMAGCTMTFQVYHSIHYGRMPWELAVLYGVVPLAISIGVLDFVAEWEDAPKWASPSAYVITAGSMFLSAAATGSVVLHAAPGHLSGLFGVLLDWAALLAIRFILTAPRKARTKAAEEAARQEAAERAEAGELARALAELDRARSALDGTQSARAEAERDAAAMRAEAGRLAATASQANEAVTSLRADLEAAARTAGEEATARAEAERQAAQANAKAATLARKLDAQPGTALARKSAGKNAQKGDAVQRESGVPEDVGARAEALMILANEPGISGAQLGERCGMSKRWGQDLRKSLAQTAPHGIDIGGITEAGPEASRD